MSGHAKTSGQVLVERLAAWVGGFLFLSDPTTAVVIVLWALGTWVHERFFSFPFLAVTASVKGAGKTRVLELLKLLARQGPDMGGGVLLTAEPTPAAVLGLIRDYDERFTLLWDEADAASSEKKTFMSAMVNTAYRKGATIPRRSGEKVIEWKSYCPITFALIGDLNNTFRDRSIVVNMERGQAAREFESEMALGVPVDEAEAWRGEIVRLFMSRTDRVGPAVPAHLQGRDKEIWASIFGLASYLGLDETMMGELRRWSSDNAGFKTAAKRSTTSYESELDALMAAFAERAMKDLASVFLAGEDRLTTGDAVGRMRGIADAPWRTFRGKGLDGDMLCALVKGFGVHSRNISFGPGGKGKGSRKVGRVILKGFYSSDVFANVPKTK